MDILITIGLVYLAYRGYNWYNALQQQVKGKTPLREVPEEEEEDVLDDITVKDAPQPLRDDDYIDYEEVK
jgi:hypothetical protein